VTYGLFTTGLLTCATLLSLPAPSLRGGAIADTFIAKGLRVERRHDRWNGTSYMAWRPHVSMLFTDTKELLRFIAWPRKTPTGDALREWLNSPTAPTTKTKTSNELP
jgi:hypothetical protein